MRITILTFLFISFFGISNASNAQELFGKWQLVYFDGIDQIRNSPQFREATATARTNMEYRIKNRLENTVYEFFGEDSLKYTDMVNQKLVLRKATFEVDESNTLIIKHADLVRKAQIVELTENKLILQPISQSGTLGRLIFEPYVEPEED
ncbi:lipocalin family protein [Algoriphagus limi]|uniref:Lipocalin family protein n=1 Tax=Algoriphagus limi TaxID=2975273 RepID=A0ABT2G4F6_9BACT|nr:lipocalin family protein [Algoriphagus limi]MCS5490149.1 lipocalin family protein [Algoriphagus limi]